MQRPIPPPPGQEPAPSGALPPHQALRRVLFGDAHVDAPAPPASELAAAALALAAGTRRKALLAVPSAPVELALVRSGAFVEVTLYADGPVPTPLVSSRALAIDALLAACADALDGEADAASSAAADARRRLAERTRTATTAPERLPPPRARRRVGGAQEPPADAPVAFGFDVRITAHPRPAAPEPSTSERADGHALLFPGSLWVFLHGRRLVLVEGAIVPALLRLVAVARAVVEAWEAERPLHVRLREGAFLVGARRDRAGHVALTLGSYEAGSVTAPDLPPAAVVAPILQVTGELVRALVDVDRHQARNLRVRTLRRELHELRRRLRRRAERAGFVNDDPDRLRASWIPAAPAGPGGEGDAGPPAPAVAAGLRFSERWRVELDALDATATFAAGDRLVVAAPHQTLALDRDTGGLAWLREGLGGQTLMAGRVLVRLGEEGEVELCRPTDGETYASARVPDLAGWRSRRAVLAGGGDVPAVLVLPVGGRLVALDVRTGEPRWRAALAPGEPHLARAGRVLVARCAEGIVHALDAATGEVVWRAVSLDGPFVSGPRVTRETVVAGTRAGVEAIELFTGRLRWRRSVEGRLRDVPLAAGRYVVAATTPGDGGGRGAIVVLGEEDGALRLVAEDPGLSAGGAALEVDGTLVVNGPTGRVSGIPLDGGPRWTRRLADPLEDELPRRLEPVLRSGALFVPSAGVHLLRPADGAPLGEPLPGRLVPDFLRVDERGWAYVGEETGALAAYAPVPHLRIVR